MDTLTDRYVWTVTRRLPHARQTVVSRQLRNQIGTVVTAKIAAGAVPDEAEEQAIVEFGDPDRRRADMQGRPGYLIGPAWFFDYRRIMIVVLAAVAPSVFGALLIAQLLASQPLVLAAGTALSVAFTVSVQVGFWITVAFAVIERVSGGRRSRPDGWEISDLPVIPAARVGLVETVVAILAYLLFIGLVVWQRNIWIVETAGGEPLPLLDPALWGFWIPWFLVLAVLEIAFALLTFGIGRWTWSLAWVNVALNLAFAVPAIGLISGRMVLSEEFSATFREAAPFIDAALTLIPFIIGVVAVLDSADGFRKAYRGSRPVSRETTGA